MNNITIGHFPELGYATEEALNTLCLNLTFAGENIRRIMVTSCQPSEGKSFITMNLMRTFTKLGYSVALVDADLRRSNIKHAFDLQFPSHDHLGLTHLLAGMAEEEDVIYHTGIGNCLLVPVGRNVSNSLSLLNSPRFPKLLDTLSAMVDYVLVDSPPVGSLIDAAEIAKSCDGSLIVVSYNRVTRQELREAKQQLDQTTCPILGAVLNRVEFDNYLSRKYYKSYYYQYDYASDHAEHFEPAPLMEGTESGPDPYAGIEAESLSYQDGISPRDPEFTPYAGNRYGEDYSSSQHYVDEPYTPAPQAESPVTDASVSGPGPIRRISLQHPDATDFAKDLE